VFLNAFKSAERSRLDAAHELAHLVLHKHGGPRQGRDAEIEANNFASSFLMPKADVRSRLPFVGRLDELLVAKKRWGVSTAALAYLPTTALRQASVRSQHCAPSSGRPL
jgi:Zn-dependent peptidase ImmA (M78 family)